MSIVDRFHPGPDGPGHQGEAHHDLGISEMSWGRRQKNRRGGKSGWPQWPNTVGQGYDELKIKRVFLTFGTDWLSL